MIRLAVGFIFFPPSDLISTQCEGINDQTPTAAPTPTSGQASRGYACASPVSPSHCLSVSLDTIPLIPEDASHMTADSVFDPVLFLFDVVCCVCVCCGFSHQMQLITVTRLSTSICLQPFPPCCHGALMVLPTVLLEACRPQHPARIRRPCLHEQR